MQGPDVDGHPYDLGGVQWLLGSQESVTSGEGQSGQIQMCTCSYLGITRLGAGVKDILRVENRMWLEMGNPLCKLILHSAEKVLISF